MNKIEVTAYGEPGSFARRVQENPRIALELLDAARELLEFNISNPKCYEDSANWSKAIDDLGKAIARAENE